MRTCGTSLLTVDGVNDEQTSLDVGDDDIGPDRDTGFRVEWDCEPLLPPGPDPSGMVCALNCLGDQCGVTNHALDAIQHETSLLATDVERLPLLGEGGQRLL